MLPRIAIGLMLFSTGCASPQLTASRTAAKAAAAEQEAAMQACEKVQPQQGRPSLPRIKCINEAVMNYHEAYARAASNPYLDLARVMTTQTVVVAERYDAGRMTEAEFKAALAQIESDFDSKVDQRKHAKAIARSAADQARAAQDAADHAGTMARQSSLPVICSKGITSVTCF